MTWRRVLHGAVRLYPAPWRTRYGAEMGALVDDMLDGPGPRAARLAAGLAWGGLKERLRPTVRAEQGPVLQLGYPARRFLHRDLMFRTRLDAPARALIGPREEVFATFDAVTAHPLLNAVSAAWLPLAPGVLLYVFAWLVALVSGHMVTGPVLVIPLPVCSEVLLAVAAGAFCRSRGSRRVMFAITSRGTVECKVDRLRQPCDVLHRAPAGRPTVLRRARGFRLVAIGGSQVWVSRETDAVIAWMTAAAPA
jgi:hypothetical protein